MKSDARLLLNKKKWRKASGNNKIESWKNRGTVDARKILNLKRSQKLKPPVLGSYMRTKTATALIASQIRKEISSVTKVPDKRVQLSRDGNIIVTSKSKNTSQIVGRKEVLPKSNFGISLGNSSLETMQYEPSTSRIDDLEHTAIEDLVDMESLPPAFVPFKALQNSNLALRSPIDRRFDTDTMVADQVSKYNAPVSAKVYVSNLHPTVSREDVMELFGDVGVIRNVEMVMPGTAIIDFYNDEDAEKACDIYHNRLLDGLPMKCYLQSASSHQRISLSQRLGNRNEPNLRPMQMAVLPTVTNSRSRYNPRNVQFTVKLT